VCVTYILWSVILAHLPYLRTSLTSDNSGGEGRNDEAARRVRNRLSEWQVCQRLIHEERDLLTYNFPYTY